MGTALVPFTGQPTHAAPSPTPADVRSARSDLREYLIEKTSSPVRDSLMVGRTVGGHKQFTPAEAIGLQHLQWRYQELTQLRVITGTGERTIVRPSAWLKRPPLKCAVGVAG